MLTLEHVCLAFPQITSWMDQCSDLKTELEGMKVEIFSWYKTTFVVYLLLSVYIEKIPVLITMCHQMCTLSFFLFFLSIVAMKHSNRTTMHEQSVTDSQQK